MQFYRDGYRPGDPDIKPASPLIADRPVDLPEEMDVLIVGTGPAGTVLAAQLSEFPEINTRIIERRAIPLQLGHADGVACRTVEMFDTFGLSQRLMREAYWVNEVRFWGPSEADRSKIERTGWVEDTPEGISEFPHVIVNQARMQEYLLEYAANSPSRLSVNYSIEFVDLEVGEGEYPVTATLKHNAGPREGETFTVKAKYVIGCDGARSGVRTAIGRQLHGDAANHAWGVMDILANTDFPDWRLKSVIQSAGKGSILTIPREGGTMVRCYVDLGEVPAGDSNIRNTTVEQLTDVANAILHPYKIDVRSVAWSSVYEVGQRVTDKFDDVPEGDTTGRTPRVFIAGDACHTHSAKAGQGMNVSVMDTFNLGWKLAAVLRGKADAELLHTYSAERQSVAVDLINFDKEWSAFIAQPTVDPEHPELGGVTSEEMRDQFARQLRYTAGMATKYAPSALTGTDEHQGLATGFEIGTRFHSAPVTRVADARRYQLGHVHKADGRYRIYAFADEGGTALREFAQWLSESPDAPTQRFRAAGEDIDAAVDVHAIFPLPHHDVDVMDLPEVLLPKTGPFGLQDWEKVWALEYKGENIFEARGISSEGAVVVVRPDQYVAHVLPLSVRGELTEFLGQALSAQNVTA